MVALATSDLARSPNRFVRALPDAENWPISNARLITRVSNVRRATTAELKAETTVRHSIVGPSDRGSSVTRVEFDEAGRWGLAVIAALPSGQEQVSRVAFTVSKTPAIGARPPASRQATLADKPFETLWTAKARDPLPDRTVADALAAGRPMLALLGGPGFCASATCGPSLTPILAARQRCGDRLQWLHPATCQVAQPPASAPVVMERNLPSEPWPFLVNATGVVVDKFDGGLAPAELDPALEALLVG